MTKNVSITAIEPGNRGPTPHSLPTRETVDARGNGTLVGEVSGDTAFVLRPGTADESRVEDEPVLGGVATGL